jgi:hypothetical protein
MEVIFQHRSLTKSELVQANEILGKISAIIKKWQKKLPVNTKHQYVCKAIFNNPHNILSKISDDLHDEFHQDAALVARLRQPQEEFGNRTVEQAVLEGHSKMAIKISLKWSRNNNTNSLTTEDLLQECYIKIYDVMYRWSPDGGCSLSTLIYKAIDRHMSYVVNTQGSPLSHLKDEGMKLLSKFNKARKNVDDNKNVDEIIDSMDLCEDEKQHLKEILVIVNNETNYSESRVQETNEDYTANRKIIQVPNEIDFTLQKIMIEEILQKSNLTPIEHDLIVNSMHPCSGWQLELEIATKHGKSYTRQRLSVILKKAKQKVERCLKRIA